MQKINTILGVHGLLPYKNSHFKISVKTMLVFLLLKQSTLTFITHSDEEQLRDINVQDTNVQCSSVPLS